MSHMSKPRVLLGDDHALMVEGLRSVLSSDFDIVGVASNGRDLVAEAGRLKPDAVLLDVSMPLLNGMEAARRIRQVVPLEKLIFVTQEADRAYVEAALELGASSYILKECVVQELVTAVLHALDGRSMSRRCCAKEFQNHSFTLAKIRRRCSGRCLLLGRENLCN